MLTRLSFSAPRRRPEHSEGRRRARRSGLSQDCHTIRIGERIGLRPMLTRVSFSPPPPSSFVINGGGRKCGFCVVDGSPAASCVSFPYPDPELSLTKHRGTLHEIVYDAATGFSRFPQNDILVPPPLRSVYSRWMFTAGTRGGRSYHSGRCG